MMKLNSSQMKMVSVYSHMYVQVVMFHVNHNVELKHVLPV